MILLGIIPAGIFGVLFKSEIEGFFSSIFYLSIFFIISGVIIYSTKFFKQKREKINWLDSVFIGVFQAAAIVPGISRSGATISAGMFRGIKKENALKFSFFLSIPVILGAFAFELNDLVYSEINIFYLFFSFVITFAVSLFTIKVLLKIISGDKFYLFGIYNFAVGILLLILNLFKVIQ